MLTTRPHADFYRPATWIRRGGLALLVLIGIGASTPVSAAVMIDLLPGAPAGGLFVSATGPARGILFTADTGFSIGSAGIFLDAGSPTVGQKFDLLIFTGDSRAGAAGPATFSKLGFTPTNTDPDWFDTDLSFSFLSGVQYTLVWRTDDGDPILPVNTTLYGMSTTTEIAPFLTLDAGRSGTNGELANSSTARFRFITPEPAGWILLVTIGIGLLVIPRRRA